jgi:hypothetical protein
VSCPNLAAAEFSGALPTTRRRLEAKELEPALRNGGDESLITPTQSKELLMSVSRSTNIRHAFFILAGVVALVLTWPHAFHWMAAGGNILNPVAFFGDAIAPGGTAAFLSIDMAIAWLVFMVWVVFDSKRIGLGYKWGWIFVALSYVGVSMAFPVYLVTRERFLEKHARASELSSYPT